LSVIVNGVTAPFNEALSVADTTAVTAAALAVNPALEELAATDTLEGTVTLELLELKLTAVTLVGAEVRVTVQESAAGPVTETCAQETAFGVMVGGGGAVTPVPLKGIVRKPVCQETEMELISAPAVVGLKITGKDAEAPAGIVPIEAAAVRVNGTPTGIARPVMPTVPVPVFVSFTVWLAVVFTVTFPKATEAGEALSV
jgi:hypothetical protein